MIIILNILGNVGKYIHTVGGLNNVTQVHIAKKLILNLTQIQLVQVGGG